MAAVGRGGETSIMNNNIYDNNAKEIDPAKVRAVIATLIESNFNLVDDVLKDLNYSPGVSLEQQINNAANTSVLLHSKSAVIPVRTAPNGTYYNGEGNATFRVNPVNGNIDDELEIMAAFPSVGTSNYMPIIAFERTGTPWNESIGVIVNFGSVSATSIRIYLQRVYDNPFGKIWLTLLKLP